MESFEQAFRVGIDAARRTQFHRDEVVRVLREFSASLEGQSRGALIVEIKTTKNVLSDILAGFASGASPSTGMGIFVTSKSDTSKSRQIAGWKQSPDGFPCWIVYGGQDIACMDRQGLESELIRLAASPQMGEAVLSLLPEAASWM